MSYHTHDAEIDQASSIGEALQTRDSEALFLLAGILKEQGDDEEAERLHTIARTIEKEDWAHDEHNDNL